MLRALHPTKASEWTTINETNRHLLKQIGGVPVNDVYWELWQAFFPIVLIYGGRGGGKSQETAQRLIEKSLTHDYFKCYFGRKVYDDVRETCFDTLVAVIVEHKLQKYFHYSTAQTSSMVITAKNGNKFIPFGVKDATQLKSIKDPTHFWCEEFDQFTFEDFKEIYPTLRTLKGENQFIGTFNSYSVFPTHWIMKVFFPDIAQYELNESKPDISIFEASPVQKIFVNYYDNHFINKERERAKFKLISAGNDRIFEGLANGAWGIPENKSPWLHAFDEDKHVVDDIPLRPAYPVYLSFDFNREPLTCIAFQMSSVQGTEHSFVDYIKEFSADIQLEELCKRIKQTYPYSILYVTGDASGDKGDVAFSGRNETYYTMIKRYLHLTDKAMNLNKKNLPHNDSRNLCNMMLANYPKIRISKKGCPKLINDCLIATLDVEKGEGKLLKDREMYKMDLLDAWRYSMQTYFLKFVNKVWANIA